MSEHQRDLRGKTGDVYRAVIDAAGQAHLNLTELKALTGVVRFTVSYGKATDRVTTLRIAQHVGITSSTERGVMRETGRALRSLQAKGLVVYEPGRQGTASLVGIHPTILDRVALHPPKGGSTPTDRVGTEPPLGGSPPLQVGGSTPSLPRKTLPKSLSNDGAAACAGCGAVDGLEPCSAGTSCSHCGVVTRAA